VRPPAQNNSVRPEGSLFDASFEWRVLVQPNGDVDDLVALEIHNVGTVPYSFDKNDQYIKFPFTDSVGECIIAHDSVETLEWKWEQRPEIFLVAARPTVDIAPGMRRTFSVHVLRRSFAVADGSSLHFQDPVILGLLQEFNLRSATGTATIIFPEHAEGWDISAADASSITTRAARWDFKYGPDGFRRLCATGRTPAAEREPVLLYDDICADLDSFIGLELCGERVDYSDFIRKVKATRDPSIRDSVSTLLRGLERDHSARLMQLRAALESMRKLRPSFLRNVKRTRAVPSRVPSRSQEQPPRPKRPSRATNKPIKLFIAYAPQDDYLRAQLQNHLKPLERGCVVLTWSNRDIQGGENRPSLIAEQLRQADVVLLLLSADYLASDECYSDEIEPTIERASQGKVHLLPVVLRPCEWHAIESLGQLRALPEGGKAITSWPNMDEAFASVVRGVDDIVKRLQDSKGGGLV